MYQINNDSVIWTNPTLSREQKINCLENAISAKKAMQQSLPTAVVQKHSEMLVEIDKAIQTLRKELRLLQGES